MAIAFTYDTWQHGRGIYIYIVITDIIIIDSNSNLWRKMCQNVGWDESVF